MFQFCKTHGFTKSPALVFLIIHFRSIFPGVIKPVPPDNGQDSWHDNQGIREQWGGQTSPSGDLIIWRAAIVLLTLEVATPCTGSLWPNSTEYGLVEALGWSLKVRRLQHCSQPPLLQLNWNPSAAVLRLLAPAGWHFASTRCVIISYYIISDSRTMARVPH